MKKNYWVDALPQHLVKLIKFCIANTLM